MSRRTNEEAVSLPAQETAELLGLAEHEPAEAVAQAYAEIERAMRDRLNELRPGGHFARLSGRDLFDELRETGAASEENLRALRGVITMHSLALHRRSEISPEQAVEFVAICEAVVYALSAPPAVRVTRTAAST